MSQDNAVARALAIRDHLMPLIRVYGAMQEVSGTAGHVAVWQAGSFTCTVRSPFKARPAEVPPDASYERAASRQRAKSALPWCLEVWHGHTVLNLQWRDDGTVEVISFTRGPWEDAALALQT
jgi:hypothetical protein